MSEYCSIYYAGSCKAPYNWITSVSEGTNRLIYMTGGEGGCIKDGVRIPFKKDCLYLIPGNAYHASTYTSYESDDTRLDHAYANFEIVPPIASGEIYCLDSFDDEMKAALEVFKTFCSKCTSKWGYANADKLTQSYLRSTVRYLVDRIAEKYSLERVKDKVVLKSLNLMNKNLRKKPLISEIAKECHLSTNGFIRRFKREMGETPYSYLKKLKIRTAQNMRLSDATLEEIADRCGYSDASALLHAIGKNEDELTN